MVKKYNDQEISALLFNQRIDLNEVKLINVIKHWAAKEKEKAKEACGEAEGVPRVSALEEEAGTEAQLSI